MYIYLIFSNSNPILFWNFKILFYLRTNFQMNESAWKLEILKQDFNITNYFLPNDVYESTVFACLYALIFVFGIVANIAVIGVYMTSNNLKNNTRYFFVNLSLSDIISLLICIPNAISDLFIPYRWKFGFYYCNVFLFFFSSKVAI